MFTGEPWNAMRSEEVAKLRGVAPEREKAVSLFKRNKIWWTDFSVNGVRYRQSLDTTDWRAAQASEKNLIADASTGKLAPASKQFSRLAFCEAADRYLE